MRVLLVATPLPGHVLPLLPLATALRDAGAEVVVATAGDALAVVPEALSPTDVAPGLRLAPLMLRFALRHPGLARQEAAGRGNLRAVGALWAPVNRHLVDGVEALAQQTGPDLVVIEPFAVVGAYAAARRGVPYVVVDNSLFDGQAQLAAVADAYGGDPLPSPARYLTTAPRSLVGTRTARPMRFVPPGLGATAPEDLAAAGDRPRVFVSRSTVGQPGKDRLMTTVVRAATGTDLELVLARPDRWVTRRPLPANVRTTDWVAFPAVLPAAAGIVHHGGAGTLLTALACGTPQLLVPGPGDRRVNAGLVAARGAGLSVELGHLDRAALERLVGDADLAVAAREVAAEMAAMPHPRELAPELADLAGSGPLAGSRREPASGGGQGGPAAGSRREPASGGGQGGPSRRR